MFQLLNKSWKSKKKCLFSICNFELKLKCAKMIFFISILIWKLNNTFGARIDFYVLYLNFSIETKIKTLLLISYFNLSKKRNGTLGTRIQNIYGNLSYSCCCDLSFAICSLKFKIFLIWNKVIVWRNINMQIGR